LVAGGTAAALARKLPDVPAAESVRLTLRGHLAAGRQLAKAITRVWWPLALLAAAFVPRARLPLLLAALAPSVADSATARSVQPLLDAPALLVDEMAYGAGVWQGVVQQREPGPLLPEFTSWPPRGER
jgi:hypothetical protein